MKMYREINEQKLKEVLENLYVLGQEAVSIQIDEMILEIQEQLVTLLEANHKSN